MILFFYCNKQLNLHMRIRAMDKYEQMHEQQTWMASESLKIYFFAFLFVVFIQKIYFENLWTFLFFCNVWIPQIIKNVVENN